jgi:hypothetical protein
MGNHIYFKIAGHVDLDMLHVYSFWNKQRKVLKFWKFDEKKGNNSKIDN